MELARTTFEKNNYSAVNYKQKTILIVEDWADNFRFLSEVLNCYGYKVQSIKNGSVALQKLKTDKADLILLNVNHPNRNSYELCQQIKELETTKDTPIIFLSVLDEVTNKVRGFEVGGVDYITKPFQISEVIARIETQLRLSEQRTALLKQVNQYRQTQAILRKMNTELRRSVLVDSLTQISNRRRFDEYLAKEWRRHLRDQDHLSLILCDIDFFKSYNDTYGHLVGDNCLKTIAQTINQSIKRSGDLVARYGGEEFGIILPRTSLEGAITVAQNIMTAIHQLKHPHETSSVCAYVTLSAGITSIVPSRQVLASQFLNQADEALYEAKIQGRDRFCFKLLED